jgi:hypothetical protein
MLMIGDGWPAHRRSREVKAFRSETDGRVHLEQLPGDAPELKSSLEASVGQASTLSYPCTRLSRRSAGCVPPA